MLHSSIYIYNKESRDPLLSDTELIIRVMGASFRAESILKIDTLMDTIHTSSSNAFDSLTSMDNPDGFRLFSVSDFKIPETFRFIVGFDSSSAIAVHTCCWLMCVANLHSLNEKGIMAIETMIHLLKVMNFFH